MDEQEAYENAEAAYLDAVRSGRTADLAVAALAVCSAADAWQVAAWASYFSVKSRSGQSSGEAVRAEIEAEQAEVLAGLWRDLAEAHRGAHLRQSDGLQ